MAKIRSVSLIVLVSLITTLCLPGQAEAYYDDMHYHFTYYMARSVGYTPEQAFRIASADVAVDWDEQTEPVQQNGQVIMWASAAASYARDQSGKHWENIRLQKVSPVSIPRIRFHAMMDCLNWPLCHFDVSHRARALEVIPVYREQLWQSGLNNGNFGAFLHFLEDEPPHAGYPSDNGHWMGVDMWWNNNLLQMGSATDYIDYNGNDGKRNRRGIISKEQQRKSGFLATGDMINEVLKRMSDFAALKIPKQKLRSPSPIFSKNVIQKVYWELRKANPVTNAPGFQESAGRAFDNTKTLFPIPALMMISGIVDFGLLWKVGGEPKSGPAYKVVTQALDQELHSLETTYPYERYPYDLDKNGNPIGQHMIDKWVLSGNLLVDFSYSRDDWFNVLKEPLDVEIKSVPTFRGEKSYTLAQAKGEENLLFEDLPIGEVSIEVYNQGKLLRKTTQKLLRQNTFVRLAIDLKNEKSQLDLDNYLERMRELIIQLRKDRSEFEKTDEETKNLIEALNDLIGEIEGLSAAETGAGSLGDQARELVELSRRQIDWSSDIKNGLASMEMAAEEVQGERDFVCSAEIPMESLNGKTKIDPAIDASIAKQEALLANAESIFLGVRNSFERYKNFYDRLGRLNQSAPESFSNSLEELYKKAEKNLESMATLYHNIGSAKTEIEDIYEFANRLIDQSLDALNDEVGRENQLTTSSAFYEELRTPFIDIYRESQDIKAGIQAGVDYREALDDIAKDWDTILDALREYEILYRDLRSGDINTDSFRDAAVNFEKTSVYLQLIKMLLNESRQCLANEAGGKPTTDDICTTHSSVLAASRDVVNELDTELFGAQMNAIDDEDALERIRRAIPRVDALTAHVSRFTEWITLGRDRSGNLRDQICSVSKRFSTLEAGASKDNVRLKARADLGEIRTLRGRAESWQTLLDGVLAESEELTDALRGGTTLTGSDSVQRLAELKGRLANTRAAVDALADTSSIDCKISEDRASLATDLDAIAARLEELHNSALLKAGDIAALRSQAAIAATTLDDAMITADLLRVFVGSILSRAAEAERCAALLEGSPANLNPQPVLVESPSSGDGWSTGERTDETGNGWSTGERIDEVDACRGPRPDFEAALQNLKRVLQDQNVAALAPAIGRLRPECPGDVALLRTLRDQAIALARAEVKANESNMRSAVGNAKTRAQQNKKDWASALGTIQEAITEIERARTGTRSAPTTSTGTTSTTGASSSDDAFEYRCVVDDSPNHFSPEGQGRSYRYYVQKQGEWSTGVPAFAVLQYSSSVNQAPSIPGSTLDGPFYTYNAAWAHVERLCPPSRRSTGSVRYQ